MLPEASVLEREFGRALGVSLTVVIATEPVDPQRLRPGEHSRYAALVGGPQMDGWLRGRTALKQLLRHFGQDDDTSALRFPNLWCSLSHSGGYAVAVGTASQTVDGIGVDLEVECVPHPDAARLFLTRMECAWLETVDPTDRARELVRLWTVKEAMFKSYSDNDHTWLTDYRLVAPGQRCGRAFIAGCRGMNIRYATIKLQDGPLSMAILSGREETT